MPCIYPRIYLPACLPIYISRSRKQHKQCLAQMEKMKFESFQTKMPLIHLRCELLTLLYEIVSLYILVRYFLFKIFTSTSRRYVFRFTSYSGVMSTFHANCHQIEPILASSNTFSKFQSQWIWWIGLKFGTHIDHHVDLKRESPSFNIFFSPEIYTFFVNTSPIKQIFRLSH